MRETEFDRTLVVAHRGASGQAPENTCAAFDIAVDAGADLIELDVRLTADRKLVVFHDLALGRFARNGVWDFGREVSSLTLGEVLRVDVGSWFNDCHPAFARPEFTDLRPPTLAEVFDRYKGRTRFFIEVKDPESSSVMEVELLGLLHRYGITNDDIMLGSLSASCLRRLRSMDPSLSLARIVACSGPRGRLFAELEHIGTYAQTIVAPKELVSDDLAYGCARARMDLFAYTANGLDEFERLWRLGVQGIMTDFPERLRTLLAGRERRLVVA